MTYLIILIIWIILGNLWFDLLNDISSKLGKKISFKARIIIMFIWPYSILRFMEDISDQIPPNSNRNIGDNPDTLNNMVNGIEQHVANTLNTSLEEYREVINTSCTDDEVEDIIGTIIANESEDEINRVKQLFNSKL